MTEESTIQDYAEAFGEKFDAKPVFKRTAKQNAALHSTLRRLGDKLNEAGLDCKKVLKPEIDIPWTLDLVKDQLFNPIAQAMFHKSSSELTTVEMTEVYEVLNRHMGEKFSIHQEWLHEL